MAGTQLMRHLAREDVVRELTYTARTFSAEEALAYGFATRLVEDPRAAAMAIARDIAGRSPDAVRAAKRLLNQVVACEARAGLIAETIEQGQLIGRPNQVEALKGQSRKAAAALHRSRCVTSRQQPGTKIVGYVLFGVGSDA
jgi:enoyl-CoA hydratase/carnithine racemase